MQEKLDELKKRLAEIQDIYHMLALSDWDTQTYMPTAGSEERGFQQSTLSAIAHEKFTSPEIGRLLDDLKVFAAQQDPDSDDSRLIRVVTRDYQKQVKVPTEFVSEFAHLTALSYPIWVEARQETNFKKFQPYLAQLIGLRRQYAQFFAPFEHIYDVLLDDFEPGMKTAEVKTIFQRLRTRQVELIQAISEKPVIDDSFLRQTLDEKKQEQFGLDIIKRFGFDFNRGRQDTTAHPFTTSFGIDDVRITTRFAADDLALSLFATIHETGHALYEQGFDRSFQRSPLASAASLAVHESQSRMWENLVGLSRDFWVFFYPRLQETFPTQFGNIDLETFYRAVNKVNPSLIRIQSDEATYNLHIMLRLELEIELMEGSLDAQSLPEAWNARMRDYLGLTPPNDSLGVLQDVHWSGGSFGYFPTYALGNLISAQLWEKILADLPDLPQQIRRGEFAALLAWLREKIHRHGAKFEPQELIQKVTGSKIDPEPYLRYLSQKYGEIYQL